MAADGRLARNPLTHGGVALQHGSGVQVTASDAAARRVFRSKVDSIRPTYGFEDVSLAPGTSTVEPADVDAEFERVGGGDAEETTGGEVVLEGTPLGGEVARSVRGDAVGEGGGRRGESVAGMTGDHLGRPAAAGEGERRDRNPQPRRVPRAEHDIGRPGVDQEIDADAVDRADDDSQNSADHKALHPGVARVFRAELSDHPRRHSCC